MNQGYEAHFLQRLPAKQRVVSVERVKSAPTTRKRHVPKLKNIAKKVREQATSGAIALERLLLATSAPTTFSTQNPEALRPAAAEFPAFVRAVHPVEMTPNWGAMRTPQQWNRRFDEMTSADFVNVPPYDAQTLTTPLSSLLNPIEPQDIPIITAKLYYSTRYFSSYDLDAWEFSGTHPGLDLKLAPGTPVGAIGGGRVVAVRETSSGLGLHVILEHRLKNGETLYSIYGHLEQRLVSEGDEVQPGQPVGLVGMTGNTSAPHLHLQIDRGEPGEEHQPYAPRTTPSRAEAAEHTVSPIELVREYGSGE